MKTLIFLPVALIGAYLAWRFADAGQTIAAAFTAGWALLAYLQGTGR